MTSRKRYMLLALAALASFGTAGGSRALGNASNTVVVAVPPPQIAVPQPGTPPGVDAFLSWDNETKLATVTNGTLEAKFVFNLTNRSPVAVTISGVHTSCGCTAAELPPIPWVLAPGTNGAIHVTMNLAGKQGMVPKTVTVNSDKGSKLLFVKANILPPAAPAAMNSGERETNQKIALTDRQAVFRGDCARCHSISADKLGRELFTALCGVCHEAEHRASMVPNLHALPQETNAEYWRNWITHGKPGTLMPAFSAKEAGILTDAQIESLVTYLTNAIPSKVAAPTPGR